ncbi:aspartyl-phosphate phosphatase Spo0E family protein [Sediminibacillus albus]|uniref:Spo0E like sporulation regulatory protein n=1 Tax=Sediminibacillus albus TaxID=407036 RepID=A0A1G8YR45_9BACI|nr:aspartyl-phosphate phosphatase Spo0E family protein [Sediminibacillus albus]SDK05319.1 Spo0E like sporulation regulatory protein [Sediminibacillus albus]
MVYSQELEQKIECLREKMYEAYKQDPSSPKVIEISQTLDKAINQLDSQKRNK